MKILTKVATILMVASALLSCKKVPTDYDPKPEKPDQPEVEVEIEYTEDIEFSIKVLSVEATSAEIKVEHTGTKDDTWYGFVTTSTNVSVAIANMVEELTENDDEKITGLLNGVSKTIKLEDLKPDTQYFYIAFAITADGDVYGTEEYEEFETLFAYEINPAWTVEYTGRMTISKPNVGDYEFENTVSVTSSDDNPYFITVVPKSDWLEMDIEKLLQKELDNLLIFIGNFNEYYEVTTLFKSWCFSGNGVDAFELSLGYTYVALAIGVNEKAELTGLYAVSEEFLPYEEEMTPEYESWIGDWIFTGANGVAFDINFRKGKSNKTFIMSGWEGEEASHCEVIVDWYENSWMIWSQFIMSGSDPKYGKYEIYFCPVNAKTGYIGEYPMCVGTVTDNGSRMVGINQEEGFTFTHMQFLAEWPDGIHPITRTSQFPTFPITVTPAASKKSTEVKTASVKRELSTAPLNVPRKTMTIKPIR